MDQRLPMYGNDEADMDDNAVDDNANAQTEVFDEHLDQEDPLLLAIDDLEGRVVGALEDVRQHAGTKKDPNSSSAQAELKNLFRPVAEVAAHTAPSIARTYARGDKGIEASVEEIYERIISELVLPNLLEMSQSERQHVKLAAVMEFFHLLWRECRKAGSWLDQTTTGPQMGPYGPGGASGYHAPQAPGAFHGDRRSKKTLSRESEILRYWVEASIACMQMGILTDDTGEGIVASRGVIAASASFRPSLQHIATRIKNTDDRGASRLFTSVMRMTESVLNKMLLGNPQEAVHAACVKFLETVVLCCSSKPNDPIARRKLAKSTMDAFSLEDLPNGHPVITREVLESIAEYAFATLRGCVLLGGQVKISDSVLSELLLGGGGSDADKVISILKPAALAYLDVESNLPSGEDESALEYSLDRSKIVYDYELTPKSYFVAINSLSTIALHRPSYFRYGCICLSRRAAQPPGESLLLPRAAVVALTAQLKSTCLTLLRNPMSVTQKTSSLLRGVLLKYDMKGQAVKALEVAEKENRMKTAGRAERQRANMFYEWDATEASSRGSSRMDDDLKKMKAAKKARGLGHGIHLPFNMTEAIELILINLDNFPSECPKDATEAKPATTFESVVDSIMTYGESLIQNEDLWYERYGGSACKVNLAAKVQFSFDQRLFVKEDETTAQNRGIFKDQSQTAASQSFDRILSISPAVSDGDSKRLSSVLSAQLAFSTGGIKAQGNCEAYYTFANEVVKTGEWTEDEAKLLNVLLETYPLAAACLAVDSLYADNMESLDSLCEYVLHEAYLHEHYTENKTWSAYNASLLLWIGSTIYACEESNRVPGDTNRKKAAQHSVRRLQVSILKLPRLTFQAVRALSRLCATEEITKKANSAPRSQAVSPDAIAAQAAIHAAKVVAEKRAKLTLLILRDIALYRDTLREHVVENTVMIAAGQRKASARVLEWALNLNVNVFHSYSSSMASMVEKYALHQLEQASTEAIALFDSIEEANGASEHKSSSVKQFAPRSDAEKSGMEKMRGPALLFMALCLRSPDLLGVLFRRSGLPKADVLARTICINMPKLAKACSSKHGLQIAFTAANLTDSDGIPLLLSFLESLIPSDLSNTEEDIVDICYKIQELKAETTGEKDPRFLIPVASTMLRKDLILCLPGFVAADDDVFLLALSKMSTRLGRLSLSFRDEADPSVPSLRGMTPVEQLVFLHHVDFVKADIQQKRYLIAINLCLARDDEYNDQVLMKALDQMSNMFVAKTHELPLAFMRTCIQVFNKYDSLHAWICHSLLPCLVEGKVYDYPRQWEGWMRIVHLLKKTQDPSLKVVQLLEQLPAEQRMQYQMKWAGE